MTIELFFPTPVYYENANSDIQEKIETEYKAIETDLLTNVKSNVWGDNIDASYGTVINLFDNYELPVLKQFIKDNVDCFLGALYSVKKEYQFTESWVNYSNKHQYQNIHTHPHAKISGVYYIQTSGEDGNIRFHPPSYSYMFDEGNNTNLTNNTMIHSPKQGKLLLFPSFAPHSVQPNMTDGTRISISFNLV